MIHRWSGGFWKAQTLSTAAGGIQYGTLYDVDAYSNKEAWAVGHFGTLGAADSKSLLIRWNGTAWKPRPTPTTNPVFQAEIRSVAVKSPSKAWAVGRRYDNSSESYRPVILQWNGSGWNEQKISSPNLEGVDASLYGVAATASKGVWAVGSYSPGPRDQTLVLYWNGLTWKQKRTPNKGTDDNVLLNVAAKDSKAWAVGYRYKTVGASREVEAIALELSGGGSWFFNDRVGTGDPTTFADVAIAPGGSWTAGYTLQDAFTPPSYRTLVATRKSGGNSWYDQPSMALDGADAQLLGIDATSPENVWVVGYYQGKGAKRPLALRCC